MNKQPLSLLLKHKEEVFTLIHEKRKWNAITAQFVLLSLVGFALFGVVISTLTPHWWFTGQLSWKMIAVLWGPTIICAPSLYVFSTIRGSRLTLPELAQLLCGMLATTAVVLLALAPISWFFTWTSEGLGFIQLMNGVMIGVSLLFGLFFFGKGMMVLNKKIEGNEKTTRFSPDILLVWFVLLLIVVVQMSDKLGPWYLQ